MSDLYKVRVLARRGRTLRFELLAIHPDFGAFPRRTAAGLTILAESAMEGSFDGTELGRSIGPLETLYDVSWYLAHADEYVERFTQDAVERYPIKAAVRRLRDDAWQAFWDDESRVPRAEYTLVATEPRWVAHLRAGASWGSAATDHLE